VSWYLSDPQLPDRVPTYNMDEGWRMKPDDEESFVDVALHVGNDKVIRIILPSGGVFAIEDARQIRDALTRAIDQALT